MYGLLLRNDQRGGMPPKEEHIHSVFVGGGGVPPRLQAGPPSPSPTDWPFESIAGCERLVAPDLPLTQ